MVTLKHLTLGPGWRLNTSVDVRLALDPGVVTYYDPSGAA